MARFCTNCGTEVDQSALFCPTCGQPIDATAEVPVPGEAAPTWPQPEPAASARSAEAPSTADERDDAASAGELLTPSATPPRQAPVAREAPRQRPLARDEVSAPPAERGPATTFDVPIVWPEMLSGWLIGIGALLAAVGLVIGLIILGISALDLVLLLLMLAIVGTAFFAASLPAVPHLRLATLVVALLATGMALERIGVGIGGAVGLSTLLLFLGSGAAAIGCILLELGQDRPLRATHG